MQALAFRNPARENPSRKVALVVLDVQRQAGCDRPAREDRELPKILRLAEFARETRVPIALVKLEHEININGYGYVPVRYEVEPSLAKAAGGKGNYKEITKSDHDATRGTDLVEWLVEMGATSVALAGENIVCCVYKTAKRLAGRFEIMAAREALIGPSLEQKGYEKMRDFYKSLPHYYERLDGLIGAMMEKIG